MTEKYKDCQSCGMPLKRDPKGSGTNADGTQSTVYCSYCYQNGSFTQPHWTAAQMQAHVKEKLRELPFHRLFAGLFTKGIPRLKRWQQQAQ